MAIYTKEILLREKRMVKEFLYFQIHLIMKEIFKMIKFMERVFIDGKMD
jgi:hypothetical protein